MRSVSGQKKSRPASKQAGFGCPLLYTDAAWGGKTHGWAASANRLDTVKRKFILNAAVKKMDWSVDDRDGDVEEGDGGFDPRPLIEL